jgi:REP element-mobilizing transposase RayT
MTLPRKLLVSLNDTPFYHCVSRCVRRAYLCGLDDYSGKDYEHRRDWLEDKLLKTAGVFAIKLCAYAVMSNHYHVVLHIRPDIANDWSDRDVVQRWHQLFDGTLFSQRFAVGDSLSKAERCVLKSDIQKWRARLNDISWFMRIVNESIARKANAEDQCTGRFWEGRFKSQALLDERALLSCMVYVDLNPIRAKMAHTPELSDHTSVKKRIELLAKGVPTPSCIESLVGIQEQTVGIPFRLNDYLELVDWTGRIIRDDKRGAMKCDLPPILQRLSLDGQAWKILTTEFELQFKQWVGSEHIVRQVCSDKHYQRIPAAQNIRRLFR